MRIIKNQVVYIPNNLSLEQILKDNPPLFHYDIEAMYYLISILYTHVETDEQSSLYGYSVLYSKAMQAKVRNYKKYMKYFAQPKVGIITDEKDRTYWHSIAYQLNPKYSSANSTQKYISNPKYFKFKKFHKKKNEQEYEKAPNYPYLEVFFNDKLHIDMEAVKQEAVNVAYSNIGKGKFNTNYILQLESKAKSIQNKDFNTCVSFHRFYSPLTHLNKAFRKLLSYNGYYLSGLDIKNSVPYILNIVIKAIDIIHHRELPHYYKFNIRKGYTFNKFDNKECYFKSYVEVYNIIYSTLYNAITNTNLKCNNNIKTEQDRNKISTKLCQCAKTIVNKDFHKFFNDANKGRLTKHQLIIAQLEHSFNKISINERERYLEITSNGTIYENLVELIDEYCGTDYLYNVSIPTKVGKKREKKNVIASQLFKDILHDTPKFKREVVKKIMWFIIGGTRTNAQHEKAFYKSFNGVSSFISDLKFFGNHRSRKYDDAKTFLQRIIARVESHIMLTKVAKEFINENPNTPVFTIHDGIFTIEPMKNKLELKVSEVFSRYLDKVPKYHIETWCKDCEPNQLKNVA